MSLRMRMRNSCKELYLGESESFSLPQAFLGPLHNTRSRPFFKPIAIPANLRCYGAILSSTHFWFTHWHCGFHKLLILYNNIIRVAGDPSELLRALIDRRNIRVSSAETGDDVNVGTLWAKLPIFGLKIYLNLALGRSDFTQSVGWRLSGIIRVERRLSGATRAQSELGDCHPHGKWFRKAAVFITMFLAWVKVAHARDPPLSASGMRSLPRFLATV